MRLTSLTLLLVLLLAPPAWTAPVAPQRAYVALASGSQLQDKAFYLLTLLQTLPEARAAVAGDPELSRATEDRRNRLQIAAQSCVGDSACLMRALSWTDEETERLGDRLAVTLDRAGVLTPLVGRHMRRSGRFQLYAHLDDRALVRRAFGDAAKAMNRIVKIYGLGEAPLYPKIDSYAYAGQAAFWKETLGDLVRDGLDDRRPGELFFDLPLRASLDLLDFNDRDEPARMEPLSQGENAKAMAYARTLDWRAYRYAAVLVPGRSPVLADNPLSPIGRLKARLGLRRWRAGLAPLIVVSGGFVNPSQTRFAEALEMKRYLMKAYGVPERAILIDPFARHTTTNIRNTERLLFEAGAPADMPILISAVAQHSLYIEGQVFRDRCQRELGYVPFTIRRRLSAFDLEVMLSQTSLHRDAADPLDP